MAHSGSLLVDMVRVEMGAGIAVGTLGQMGASRAFRVSIYGSYISQFHSSPFDYLYTLLS